MKKQTKYHDGIDMSLPQDTPVLVSNDGITWQPSKEYIRRLIELTKELQEYRGTTDNKDYTFLSKLDYLTGYILALDEANRSAE